MRADQEFGCIREDLIPTHINLASPGEHVPEVERSIRTIKERARALLCDLPYKYFPRVMIESCIYNAVRLLNNIASENGISRHLSPSTLIMGSPSLDYNQLMRIKFGDYVQVSSSYDIKNNMRPRTSAGIALFPTGNTQGGWYFLSLQTGRKFVGRDWVVLPIPQTVIDTVHQLAKHQG